MEETSTSTTPDRQPPIWILSTLLAVASVAIAWTQLRGLDQLADAVTLPIPVLIIGFMAAEYFVVHLHFRSESITISFIAMPLILGALFLDPYMVWSSMTLGAAFAFMLIRRQNPTKAAFNTSNFSLQAAIALFIMHALDAGADPLGPRGWFAAAMAAVVSTVATTIVLSAVVCLAEGRIDWRSIRQANLILALTAFTSASMALIAATLIDARPASLALLLAPILVLAFAYRSVVTEREHRERLQHVHESASQIRALRNYAAIPEMLTATATRMRAARVDLILLSHPDSTEATTWYSAVEGTDQTRPITPFQLDLAEQLVGQITEPTFVWNRDMPRVEELLKAKLHSAMMGVVRGEAGVLGFLTVTNRLGDVTRFTDDDLAMFGTIIDQLGLAFENSELGQTVTELKRVGEQLSAAALHDSLTGLANRTRLSQELATAVTNGSQVSLLYIDLDDFKLINDGLGHEAGDHVLVETSNRLSEAAGSSACVARFGGDEFVVLLVDPVDDLASANQLLDLVNQPLTVAGHEVQVGASIGLARARPGQDSAALIANADAAMYAAKGTGKGSVVIDKSTTATRIRTAVS